MRENFSFKERLWICCLDSLELDDLNIGYGQYTSEIYQS